MDEYECIGRISKAKARKILEHGSVKGHPLTSKQKRYFGWKAGSSSYGDIEDYKKVINLLNRRTKKSSREALRLLESILGLKAVGLEFSSCSEKPPSKIYGFRTGYANARRIHICTDSMGDGFNAKHSKTIRYDASKIEHYTVVFLHELGHVVDKRGLLPANYGGTSNDERIADAYAQEFLDIVFPPLEEKK